MSDTEMKTTVRVDSTTDTSGIDRMLARMQALQTAVAKLSRTSAKGLTDGLSESVKRATELGNAISRVESALLGNISKRTALEGKLSNDRITGTKAAAAADKAAHSDAIASLRERMDLTGRLARQQMQTARDLGRSQIDIARQVARVEQDAARDRANAMRADSRAIREAGRDRSRAFRDLSGGAVRIRQGITRGTVAGAATGAIMGAGARRGLDRLTTSGITIDDALAQAAIHVFGSQKAADAGKSAQALRKRLMPVATGLGTKTSELIGAYVEATQAGVDSEILDKVVNLGSKYAKMNKLSLPNTLEETGYALQGLKTFGQVTDKTVGDYFNKMSYLVATTAANRTQMSSFGKRGLAAGASVGMSIDDTLAFGGAATAAGAEGNQASRMLSSQGGRISRWGLKARDLARKGHKTEEDKLFLQAPNITGFGNFSQMSQAFKADFMGTFIKVTEGLKRVTDPLKRRALEKSLFGQEFGAITDSLVMGGNLRDYRNRLKSPEANNFMDLNWSKQTGSFGFIVDQIKSVFQNLSDSLGLALKPIYSDLRDFTVKMPAAFDNFEDSFRVGLRGFMSGLGSRDGTMSGLLKNVFGDPAAFKLNATSIGDFARGFGQGLRDVGETVKRFFTAFTGSDGSPEAIGRWTARIIGFSTALLVASPAIALLGALGTAISGFGMVLRGASAFLVGSGAGGIAARIVGGIGLAIVAELGANRGAIATWLGAPQIGSLIADGIKAFLSDVGSVVRKTLSIKGIVGLLKSGASELVPAPLERYLNSGDPEKNTLPGKALNDAFKGVGPLQKAIEQNTAIQKQSFDASQGLGLGSMIQKANLESGVGGMGARVQMAALGGLNSANIARAAGAGTAGAALGAFGVPGAGASSILRNVPGEAFSIPGAGRRFGVGGGVDIGGGMTGRPFGSRGSVGGVGASDGSPIGAFRGSQTFDGIAPRISADLQKDFALSKEETSAVLGNLGHESGGFRHMQELYPRGGGRGGYGWAQWTGPRRRAFEKWVGERGLDPKSYEANYSFLRHELQTTHRKSISDLKRANGLDGKTIAFEKTFEGAGVKAYGSRLKFARRAQGLPDVAAGVSGPEVGDKVRDALAGKPGTYGKPDGTGDEMKSTGWKKAGAEDLAAESPAQKLAKSAPRMSQGGGGGAAQVTAPINIQHIGDAQSTANAVQRRIQDVSGYHTQDRAYESI